MSRNEYMSLYRAGVVKRRKLLIGPLSQYLPNYHNRFKRPGPEVCIYVRSG